MESEKQDLYCDLQSIFFSVLIPLWIYNVNENT